MAGGKLDLLGFVLHGVIGFGLILAAIAIACAPVENILWFAFQILSVTGGPMLGVFQLGLLTQCKTNRANIPAMLISSAICLVLLVLIEMDFLQFGWSWLIVIGTGITFIISVTSRRIVAFIK